MNTCSCLLPLGARRRWKKYETKNALVAAEPIPGSVHVYGVPLKIVRYDQKPQVRAASLSDNGDGTVNLTANGRFMDGTTVRAGALTYRVSFRGTPLTWQLAGDKKAVTVDLPDEATQSSGTLMLDFEFANAKRLSFAIQVFDQRVSMRTANRNLRHRN